MFTSIDKALVALIGSAVYLVNNLTGLDLGLDEGTINAIVAVIVPILVWLVPNKQSS